MNDINRNNIDGFEYFIQTDDAIVAVYFEGDELVEGIVICSKAGIESGQCVSLNKDYVVRELYSDKVNIIEEIPEWFYSEGGFSQTI